MEKSDVTARKPFGKAAIVAWALASAVSCSGPRYEQVAIVSVPVAGRQVYFKQAVWGRNGLAVSMSADPSSDPIPSSRDYAWCCAEPPLVLFKVEGSSVHVWQTGEGEWKAPTTHPFPVAVVFHTVPVMEFNKLAAAPSEFGLKLIAFHDWPLTEPPATPVPLS
jgi:hypothetical protein